MTAGDCLGKPAGPKPQYLPALLSLTFNIFLSPFEVSLSLTNNKSTVSKRYIFIVWATSFLLAVVFFWLSEILASKLQNLFLSFLFLVIIILIGIVADIVGTSVTAAREAPFHAKGAKKVPGAQESVFLIRNADRVANICNDIIGDIAGTLSGAMGVALVLQVMLSWPQADQALLNMLMVGAIAALTIGGKAMGKRLALTRSNEVIFLVGELLAAWSRLTGVTIGKKTGRPNSR